MLNRAEVPPLDASCTSGKDARLSLMLDSGDDSTSLIFSGYFWEAGEGRGRSLLCKKSLYFQLSYSDRELS
jgi:hypothetical protein